MATSSPDITSKSSNQSFRTTTTTLISHSFFKTVCLQDWWLVKADRDFHGKRLAVGGIASRERHAARVFSSAPIVKRFDTFTLETSDGITIAIKGLINFSRTNQNGFAMEVSNHFLFGFPYYWEDYIAQYFDTCTGDVPTSVSDFNEQIMPSFNVQPRYHLYEFPITKVRDHLISSPRISDNCVLAKGYLNDILKKLSSKDSEIPGVSIHSYLNRSSASMEEETASRCKKAKIENKHEIGKDFVDPENGVESTGVLFKEEKNNISCDGLNEPESIILEGNSILETRNTTDDVAENSVLLENTDVNLLEVELQMPNSTSDKDEDGVTDLISKVSKRKGRSNSGLDRCSPKWLDSLKCDLKDKTKTVCGSNIVNLNVASPVGEKSCCGNSKSLGSDGLEGTIEESSSKLRKSRKKTERPNDSIVRRSSIRIRNLQDKSKET
ncbi:uncharacterized protein LOC122671978 [Telopea speciosissima]|uniref:uncharacterized protein LOC122671978 n=1 Tax=Telopea speciosissima TaxID=54955 RepID=UPI001CC73BAA|nr:uncharacterized protein LOC122671978 [Telopea speciosissima]